MPFAVCSKIKYIRRYLFLSLFRNQTIAKNFLSLTMEKFSIALHGGAGTLVRGMMTPEKEKSYKEALTTALDLGFKVLQDGGRCIDAVEQAVVSLEDSHLFNAGKGSVFTSEETHEMDASFMEGKSLQAGAVCAVTGVKNPVSLARKIMEGSDHILLSGAGALEFARMHHCEMRDPEYFFDELRHQQWLEIKDTDHFQLDHSKSKDHKFGTVGAVACDVYGNLAAATSTGGMTNKKFGRVGDSPIIGAGNYAKNETCAVSCTGSGEYFIQGVVAYDLSCLIEYKGLNLEDAAKEVVHHRLLDIGGDGGLIAVDPHGNIAMPFNTEGMYRASRDSAGKQVVAIYG